MDGGGGGGGQTTQTTVQNNDPWSGQRAFLTQPVFRTAAGGITGGQIFDAPAFSEAFPEAGALVARGDIDILEQYAGNEGIDLAPYMRDFNYADFFPDSTVTPQSSETLAAQELMAQRAAGGSPLNFAAQGEGINTLLGGRLGENPGLQALMGQATGDFGGAGGQALTGAAQGDFLNSNPFLDSMFDQASRGYTRAYSDVVRPGITSNFATSGRTGSGLHANAIDSADRNFAGGLSDLASSIYGQNYAQERGMQQAAAGSLLGLQQGAGGQVGDFWDRERQNQIATMFGAPDLANQDYTDFSQLAAVGASKEQFADLSLQEAMNRFNYEQQIGSDTGRLQFGYPYLSGNWGGTSTGTQTGTGMSGSGSNPLLQGLGIAASLAGMFSSSRAIKVKTGDVDGDKMLTALNGLDVDRWAYKSYREVKNGQWVTDRSEHIGPYAEDVRDALGVGTGETIHVIDMMGALLAAVQALSAKVERLETQGAE